jgi:ABC-type antimicrobial peptide transport system ATPase subunit
MENQENMSEIKFHSKDIQILRQSQQKMALEYVNSINVKLTVEELQMVTDVFVECCLRPIDQSLKTRIRKMDNWLSTKKKMNTYVDEFPYK